MTIDRDRLIQICGALADAGHRLSGRLGDPASLFVMDWIEHSECASAAALLERSQLGEADLACDIADELGPCDAMVVVDLLCVAAELGVSLDQFRSLLRRATAHRVPIAVVDQA
ncbi:MAG: hypothetical protein AB7L17_10455 [Ilumatobacteraceae bacterium]